jgi:hypothetical protein
MEQIALQEIDAILAANSVVEIDAQKNFENLFQYFDNHSSLPLSDLREIAQYSGKRISTISHLHDLKKDANTHEQHPRVKIINWFGGLTARLARYGAYPTALNLLVQLWNEYGSYQRVLKEKTKKTRHFYRAGIGMYLGQLSLQYGEQGDAVWWLLHGHADDLLEGQTRGATHDLLQLAFNVPDEVFEYMIERRDENSKSNEPHTLFAEHLVVQLSVEPKFAKLFSYPSSQSEFPIGRAYANTIIERINTKVTVGKDEKYLGSYLEEFARYLVLLMPGWVPTMNTYHPRSDMDSDVIARYVREPEAISSSHPRTILIECKNREAPLNVSEAGYFLYRMSLTQVEVGVLFVRKITGLKGNIAQDENATHLLDLAFQQNGKVVIVIDIDDLKKVADGTKTIWTLIDSGIVERRFGRSKNLPV